MAKKAIKVYVSDEDYEYIRKISETEGKSMSELLFTYAMRYLDVADKEL